MKRIKLWYWRGRLNRKYEAMRRIADGYSCGHNMLYYLSFRYRAAIAEYNKCVRAINKLEGRKALNELSQECS